MRCRTVLVLTALLSTGAGATAQESTGAFLFAYQPRPGETAAFEEGYRSHLSWHREHGDTLSWFGWNVLAGPRLGAFVDGVFGIAYAALDARVDPAGDAADMAANVRPHADPLDRELLRLRPELSTATPLEQGSPTPLIEVTRYIIRPGHMADAIAAFRALRREADAGRFLAYTVYRVEAGAEPGFVLMTWRSRLGSFDEPARDPATALDGHLRTAAEAAGAVNGLIRAVTSEVWRYRPDLTYQAGEAR